MQLMKEGGKWELYIPSELAYGDRGAGGLPTLLELSSQSTTDVSSYVLFLVETIIRRNHSWWFCIDFHLGTFGSERRLCLDLSP